MSKRTMLAAAGITAALALAGCASSSQGDASAAAKSAAASLSADPQFQAAKVRLDTNMRRDFHVTHPVTSVKAVLTETFPGADLQKIIVYSVQTFKPAARHPGQVRDAWESGVVTYALQQSAEGVGTGTAQPSIPGVTSPAASKSTP